jgi:hypothetical protein
MTDSRAPLTATVTATAATDTSGPRRTQVARDLVLPHWSPSMSTAAQDYGSEGWGFESLRARHADQRK